MGLEAYWKHTFLAPIEFILSTEEIGKVSSSFVSFNLIKLMYLVLWCLLVCKLFSQIYKS